jgi:hypothetical protein
LRVVCCFAYACTCRNESSRPSVLHRASDPRRVAPASTFAWMRGARRAWLHRGTQPPPTPDSAPPTASCSCAASLSDLAAPYLPPLPLRVTSLHTLYIAQLLVVVLHSSSSFSCCRSCACFGPSTS